MNNPKKKLQMNQKNTNAVSFPRTFLMRKKELMTLTPLMYFPDVYMNFNARAPILHFNSSPNSKWSSSMSLNTIPLILENLRSVTKQRVLGKGREICTYDFTIFVASIHGLRHGQNGRDGSYLHHGLATCGLDMH